MIKEAIDRVLALAPVQTIQVDGRNYTDKGIHPVTDPLAGSVDVATLQGLVDLVNVGVEALDPKAFIAHVVDHQTVRLIAKVSDTWARRQTLVTVNLPKTQGFNFGTWLDHETFIIGVQANFTADGDRDYVLKIASNITSEQVKTSQDDGISQQVGQKAGVALVGTETLKSRVSLAPFRTFREVTQPASEFIFRVKQSGDNKPNLALFEADGGKWKIDAVEEVARYLRVAIPSIQIVA